MTENVIAETNDVTLRVLHASAVAISKSNRADTNIVGNTSTLSVLHTGGIAIASNNGSNTDFASKTLLGPGGNIFGTLAKRGGHCHSSKKSGVAVLHILSG
ncbi:hypothetical protein N7492_002809 [Penicillium capsulatum]|uniref:Uncharacterized protein n=1 Tax=Penicillium capsulatum TaxID=69766 RepID=A0A9W9IKR4_9EURO|nr:hypothetical protein N7492_002809 [Penicillium capsulatum]KAJ6122594.1 hypothetical protein N7512_005059 [Penicillium capsulatum]